MKAIHHPLSLFVFPLALCGCASGGVPVPQFSPGSVSERVFAQLDRDKNGKLTPEELAACPALKQAFASIDRNGSGALEPDEVQARLQEILASNAGLMSVSCRVTREGQPLPQASVTFIPEAFHGDTVKKGSGVSDHSGYVLLQTEGAPQAGYLTPGFYRVEISLKNASGQETIPTNFNAKTTVGAEVGPRLRGPILIDVR